MVLQARRFPRFWCKDGVLARALQPLAAIYRAASQGRRQAYLNGQQTISWVAAPVIVIGNISVGGTGKTPLVIWMVERAVQRGYRPGVVLRGYGGRARGPTAVTGQSDPGEVGDEAVLIARQTGHPVMIGQDRAAAASALLNAHPVDLIISDDGLQHYALGRDVEVVVVDAARAHGNGRCLPAGPLREPIERASAADLIIGNGGTVAGGEGRFEIQAEALIPLNGSAEPPKPGDQVHAIAGIGHPERFFATLAAMGYAVIPHPLADHHQFRVRDFAGLTDVPIVMTEKDAVKCYGVAPAQAFYLRARAMPDADTQSRLDGLLDLANSRYAERSAVR